MFQLCRDWLLRYVFSSGPRIVSFGKFLAAFSSSLGKESRSEGAVNTQAGKGPSTKRKQLHLLYLVNELLHHSHGRLHQSVSTLEPQLAHIVSESAACSPQKFEKHHAKLRNLLGIWDGKRYFEASFIEKLSEIPERANTVGSLTLTQSHQIDSNDKLPALEKHSWYLPSAHGRADMPWEDLPAANFLNEKCFDLLRQKRPIYGRAIKPMQFNNVVPDSELVEAAEALLSDAAAVYDKRSDTIGGPAMEVDEMGQIFVRNKDNGKAINEMTTYGWPLGRCQHQIRMERKLKRENARRQRKNQSRSETRSMSPRRTQRRSSDVRSRSASPHVRNQWQARSHGLNDHYEQDLDQHPEFERNRSFQDQPVVTPLEQIEPQFPQNVPPPPTQHAASYFQHNYPKGPHGPVPPPPSFHCGPWPPHLPSIGGHQTQTQTQSMNLHSNNTTQNGPYFPPPPQPPQGNWSRGDGPSSRSYRAYPPRGSRGRGRPYRW